MFALLEDIVITPQKNVLEVTQFDKEGWIQSSTNWFCVHKLKANAEAFLDFSVSSI